MKPPINLPIIKVGVVGIQLMTEPIIDTMSIMIKYFLRPNESAAPPLRPPKIPPTGTSAVPMDTNSSLSPPQPR